MKHAIAIDDEPLALEVLMRHAQQTDLIRLEHTFTNAAEGIAFIQQNKPDVVFLDIRMPDRNGIDIAAKLSGATKVIFTTAFPQYAVKGFELNVIDYLLKPISFARFLQACQKLQTGTGNDVSQEIFVKENGAWQRIPLADLLYAEARGNYLQLHTLHHVHTTRSTMQELALALPPHFVRIHKSYIVNIKAIDRLEGSSVQLGNHVIPVSTNYKKALIKEMGVCND